MIRLKSGEIKESEIMQEASELLSKMKDMPGMGDIQKMMKQMGLGGQKLNVGAMQGKLNQNMKVAQMKERMKKKMAEKQKEQQKQAEIANVPRPPPMTTEEIDELIFSIEGEKPEKTERNTNNNNNNNKKKKKKGKKNK